MSITFTLGGVAVEQRKFQQLPSFLAAQAQAALLAHATTVAASIAAATPTITGELATGLLVKSQPRKTKARVVIVNRIRWSAGVEFGTKARYTKKHKKKAYRGAIPFRPNGRVFVPRMMQARIDLVPKIAAIMRAEGLTVTGG